MRGSQARVRGGEPGRVSETATVFAVMQSSFGSSVENPVVEQETRTAEELDLPWQVIVHNDPVNLMSYVTMVFQKVFGLTKEKAEKHMLEVHQLGRSILWSGMRERAELYVQQLHGYLLLATLERTN
jgi:ATP-dependent Clp protease adaptor protein ClpS